MIHDIAAHVRGEPTMHELCNGLLERLSRLRDLHPGNVVVGRRGAVVVDFGVRLAIESERLMHH